MPFAKTIRLRRERRIENNPLLPLQHSADTCRTAGQAPPYLQGYACAARCLRRDLRVGGADLADLPVLLAASERCVRPVEAPGRGGPGPQQSSGGGL